MNCAMASNRKTRNWSRVIQLPESPVENHFDTFFCYGLCIFFSASISLWQTILDARRFFLHLNSSTDEERNGLLFSLWVCDVEYTFGRSHGGGNGGEGSSTIKSRTSLIIIRTCTGTSIIIWQCDMNLPI